MFKAQDIRSGYGEVVVLQGLTFNVEDEIFAVLGANGAGKSTLLKTIAKLLPLMTGSLAFDGGDVTHVPAYELATQGLAFVPAVLAWWWLRPAAFAGVHMVQLSTSQFIALASGLAVVGGYKYKEFVSKG